MIGNYVPTDVLDRLHRLGRHFLATPAIPGFAWIKTLELFILGSPHWPLMSRWSVFLTVFWFIAAWYDDAIEAAGEAVDDVVDEVDGGS